MAAKHSLRIQDGGSFKIKKRVIFKGQSQGIFNLCLSIKYPPHPPPPAPFSQPKVFLSVISNSLRYSKLEITQRCKENNS
jgi:hypothetical protein